MKYPSEKPVRPLLDLKGYFIMAFITMVMLESCQSTYQKSILFQSDSFTVYKDKVIQGDNKAVVVSPHHIRSNYRSPASTTFSNLVKFKFSINEKDNELPIGEDHWLYIRGEKIAPVIKFGEKPTPFTEQEVAYLPTHYEYTFLLDVSDIFQQFEEKGYYETYNGDRIAQSDFKGFYIAGNALPLSWDFVGLGGKGLKLKPTDKPDIYSITVKLNPYVEENHKDKEWQLTEDVSHKPKYTSNQPIVDALYNLSLEEALQNIEPDSTLRTGAKWEGVWTRDVSYSTLLAFAYHEPEVAKISLRKKVKRDRIIQDTGSGGAWPISSDRTTWVLAAWEIYKVTGDQAWLDEVYPIIKNTLEDDFKTLYDSNTGLYRGESSFLDWREQTYPKWMDNKDIFTSINLGTNAVHYQAHRILGDMARLKGDDGGVYFDRAESIKKGINDHLWLVDKGYYAQYLYGSDDLIASPRFEALGEALCVLFGIADKKKAASVISKSPLTEFGATCIFPQIPGIPPYHNNAIWPFVQSYWNWAAAHIGNETVLNHGLASIYRSTALFLSNYENMAAPTGDFLGTEINSHRMLWSMAGNLAMVHRVFMGMDFQNDGLHFHPVIPEIYGGTKTLSNFNYRKAQLHITVEGHGTQIQSVKINGKPANSAFIPQDATGDIHLSIRMADNAFPHQGMTRVDNHVSLPTVMAQKKGNTLEWTALPDAAEYKVYKNGMWIKSISETSFEMDTMENATYMVSAVDKKEYEGFASKPVFVTSYQKNFEMEDFVPASSLPFSNFSGKGFAEINNHIHNSIDLPIRVPEKGYYTIDFKYANGSGTWNSDNKCAIRSLYVNKAYSGVFVFPQRGQDEWSEWGYSNGIKVWLESGQNTLTLRFEDWNNNMNLDVNRAMLDYMRIRKM